MIFIASSSFVKSLSSRMSDSTIGAFSFICVRLLINSNALLESLISHDFSISPIFSRHALSFSWAQTYSSGFEEFLNHVGVAFHQFSWTVLRGRSFSNRSLIGFCKTLVSDFIILITSSLLHAFFTSCYLKNYFCDFCF